jgi:uncharacterized protein
MESPGAQVPSVVHHHLEPRTGIAFSLRRHQRLRIVDVEGEQVSDLVAIAGDDRAEWLSSGRTFDYSGTIYLTTGHVLYSNRSNPMLTITEDRVGRHDFLYMPCSPEMFRLQYGDESHRPSCLENLAQHLAAFGVAADAIPTAFNLFQNVAILPSGELRIAPPLSKAGDFVELRAEMNLVVGVTACAAAVCNNNRCKPIDLEIRDEPVINM